jgi:hypothetical protein
VPLIVETGVGLANANAYVSVAETDTYYSQHLYSAAWADAALPQREAAIIQATAMVDLLTDFDGVPTTTTQGLRCPRNGLTNREGVAYLNSVIPAGLKRAVCELTRFLLAGDRTVDPDTAGYSSISVGAISVSIDRSDRPDVLPDIVRLMLSEFGMVGGGANVMQMIPVVRI